VIPERGEFGYETWPETDHQRFGGAHNWSAFTVDPELGMLYIPTGAPRFDWYGGNREGDNLFANSIVALDARTGARVWHFQAVHHDLWDYDLPTSPKLLTVVRNGEEVPIVIQPTKMGWLLVFDRRTGEPIWPIEEVPVPAPTTPGEKASPTQPIPSWPPHYARQRFTEDDINPYLPEEDQQKLREMLRTVRNEGVFTPVSTQGTILMPSENGGSNFGMVAVDPVNDRLFIVVRNYPSLVRHVPNDAPAARTAMPNSGAEDVQPYNAPFDFMIQSNGMVPISPPWSTITAYNMRSGNILYQIPNGDMMQLAKQGITGTGSQATRGGPAVTASDLLFVPTPSDRKFRARDASTGETLWEYDLPASGEGTPAIYEANGRQFVVIPVGWEGQFHQGLDMPPVPGTMRYMAFALPVDPEE
jgi:glucose dehydrogenase